MTVDSSFKAMDGQAPLLQVAGLTKRYGGVVAVNDLGFSLGKGQILGVIGPNGAGKSTLISMLGGALQPTEGNIFFNGRNITATSAASRARLGIGRTYQIPRPFLDMTVEENLLVPLYARSPFANRKIVRLECRALLEKTNLVDVADWRARDLPLLRRKRLEVARALALKPQLLMLDEVGGGLVDREIDELIELVRQVAPETDGIIIIEHVLRVVRECCSTTMVMNFGEKFAYGPTEDVLASDDVAAIYLGSAHKKQGRAEGANAAAQAGAEPVPDAALSQASHGLDSIVAPPRTPSGEAAPELLRLEDVCAGYGQARVLHGLSFGVKAGQAVAILGCNGAGKSTLSQVIAGTIKPTSGSLRFDGADITSMAPHRIADLGIAQCLEGRRIFPTLSVEENLLLAARRVAPKEQKERLDAVYRLFPILAERRGQAGTSMSGGQQQMLAIGRALMSRPRLVVFDEISLGLAPVIVDRLYTALDVLRKAGLTILLVEQDVERSLDLVDTAHIVSHGNIVLSGSAAEVRSHPRLKELYVGAAQEEPRESFVFEH